MKLTEQPEALRLADALDAVPETGADPDMIQEAAAELRWLHALNEASQLANEAFAKQQEWWNKKMFQREEQAERDTALLKQALEFCEFAWRDVPMNDYAFEKLNQTIDALRERLGEKA